MFSSARVSGSRANDERGDPELEEYLLWKKRHGRGNCLGVAAVAPRRASCDRLHLSVLIVPGSLFLSEVRCLGLADATAFY